MSVIILLILIGLYKMPKLIREKQWQKLAIYTELVAFGIVILALLSVQIYKAR